MIRFSPSMSSCRLDNIENPLNFFYLIRTTLSLQNMAASNTDIGNAQTVIGYHEPNYKKCVKGCNLHFPYYLALEDISEFQASPKDVAICGFPKSGSAYFSAVVGMILNGADPAFLHEGATLDRKVMFLDFCTPANEKGFRSVDVLNKAAPGRIFFSHFKFELLPPSLLTVGSKIIYHTRNPKDNLVSLHYHHASRPLSKYHGTLGEMVDAYIQEEIAYGPYFDHVASFWKHHENPNFCFTSYEELFKNPEATIKKLAVFLNVELTDEQMAIIQRNTLFENMRTNPLANRIDRAEAGIFDFRVAPFMRFGKPGHSATELTPAMNEKMNAWILKHAGSLELRSMKILSEYAQ